DLSKDVGVDHTIINRPLEMKWSNPGTLAQHNWWRIDGVQVIEIDDSIVEEIVLVNVVKTVSSEIHGCHDVRNPVQFILTGFFSVQLSGSFVEDIIYRHIGRFYQYGSCPFPDHIDIIGCLLEFVFPKMRLRSDEISFGQPEDVLIYISTVGQPIRVLLRIVNFIMRPCKSRINTIRRVSHPFASPGFTKIH